MTKQEYDHLQDLFRKKLNDAPYLGSKKSNEYKEGVRACMSILSSEFKRLEVKYGKH